MKNTNPTSPATASSETNKTRREPIAVVGASALFPGSLDAAGFWSDILAGSDLITDVPPSHWLLEDYYDPDPSVPDKTYARRGAFLPDVDFDALKWGVPPSIVPETDTSQLLALIVAQKVLEDASKGSIESLDLNRTSVILGVTSGQELLGSMVSRLQRPIWVKALREAGLPEGEVGQICDRISSHYTDWKESTFPGLLGNVVAGRIANRLNLGGTNCVTDAACASTMSALSMAVNELHLGDSDMVIAGGVDTMNDIFMFMCFSKTPALSMSGDCRPFSDNADGTMLGEGIGMVALKRLADAQRDGDRIYSVIRGVGASSDGRSKSVYAPVSAGQAKALRRAYDQAGYGPETVELVEAHGTGTKAGDAAEFGGLLSVFEESGRTDRQWCQMGSVKSQIGHTKAAAGAAGLFKTVMALHHKVLPPTIKVDQPNPKLDLENSPFHLTTRARPWVKTGASPRRASVSAFGFGGSNFHVALEEYTTADATEIQSSAVRTTPRLRTLGHELVAVGATDAAGLVSQIEQHIALCAEPGALNWLANNSKGTGGSVRLALVASTDDDLAAKLTRAKEMIEANPANPFSTPNGVFFNPNAVKEGALAFVFPGQGSQYVDMGAELAMHYDSALATWDAASDRIGVNRGVRLQDVVFPRTSFADAGRDDNKQALAATEWAQPAIGTVSQSMLSLLGELGIVADCVGGHSFGEVTALHAAGVLCANDFIDVARRRGELMAEAASRPGAMCAASATIESINTLLEDYFAGAVPTVVVANHNGPTQVVLSGPTEAIEAIEGYLGEQGVRCRRLPVATAFHSEIVSDASIGFGAFLDNISFDSASCPVYSNTLGTRYPTSADAARSLLAQQLAAPVQFVSMIEQMHASGVRTFLEVGPSSVLTGLVSRILGDRPHNVVSLDRTGKSGIAAFNEGLAALFTAGFDLSLSALWSGYSAPGNPTERTIPKLAMRLNGSNHGKPYPPAGGAADLPKPNPPRQPTLPAPLPIAAQIEQPRPLTPTRSVAPVQAMSAVPADHVPLSQLPTRAPAPLAAMGTTPTLDSSWAAVVQQTQRQTADAHAVYMNAMAKTHTAFLETVENGLAALAGVPLNVASGVVRTPTAEPRMAISVPTTSTLSAAPVFAPEPTLMAAAPAPIVVPDRAAAATPPTSRGAQTPVAETAAAAPPRDLEQMMLEIVSEKTGYPTEMLNVEMNLEGDLGIDSIKRVEILSAMQEQAPELPEVDTATMAKLQTLGEIASYMQGLLGPAQNAPASSPAVATTAVAPARDLERMMLEIVSDKTGYPTEMLNVEMNLEGDLGIDSIKRVEILSAMQEQAPELPEVDTGTMAKLQTLGEIASYMQGLLGPRHGAPPVVSAAVAATPVRDLEQMMLEIVSEKTGYPTEMLNVEMNLEGDLGIDSIKRVEILSAMQEQARELPDVDTQAMAKLQTLGEIASYMQGLLGPQHGAPPVVSAAVAATPVRDLEQMMLEIVSEKTGYPTEMLNVEMNLEGDLGIDSIKRVEILSAMQEQAPELPEVDTQAMTKLQTLGEIASYMQGLLGPTQGASTSAAQSSPEAEQPSVPSTADSSLGRFPLRAVERQAIGMALGGVLSARRIGVTSDGTTLPSDLVSILKARGLGASLVTSEADGDFAGQSDLDGLIFLGGMRKVESIDGAIAINREAFAAARAFANSERSGGLFVTVQNTGGAFGTTECDPQRMWLAGLAGLARTVEQEWQNVSVKAIDLERGELASAVLAERIADEILGGGADLDVGLPEDGRRLVLESVRTKVEPSRSRWQAGDVVVASGGARGVTAATMIELAKEASLRFVLLGRTPLDAEPTWADGMKDDAGLKRAMLADAQKRGEMPTPTQLGAAVKRVAMAREIRTTLASIEAAGSIARYLAVDVCDVAGLVGELDQVRADWGPIRAIIHGAGVIDDKLVADKTPERFDRVFNTKVAGLRALLEATDDDPLDTICLFSSVAARCGNVGQSDYAMANEVLNKVAWAEARRRNDCQVKSLGWGPWEAGMVSPQLKAHFERLGVPLIPLAVGARMLVDELCGAQPDQVEVVLGGQPRRHALGQNGGDQRFSLDVLVGRNSHPFLADHSIKGTPVVPVVLVLEWFRRAVRAFKPEFVLGGIRDVKVLRGIELDGFDRGETRLLVHCKQAGGDGAVVALELSSADGVVHYRATADLVTQQSSPKATPVEELGLETWGDRAVYDGDVLFHGPGFQLIDHIDGVSPKGISAAMKVTSRDWPEAWCADPLVLDGGLQLALLWSQHVLGGASLPTSIGEVRTFTESPIDGPLQCTLTGRKTTAQRTVSDLVFHSANGSVVAELSGVETHLLPSATRA